MTTQLKFKFEMEAYKMRFLSDEVFERRCRYRLSKYGLKLHKSRGISQGYKVYDPEDALDEGTWYADIMDVVELTGELQEKFGIEQQ